MCVYLLLSLGSPCSSRSSGRAGKEVSTEDLEQNCEGDPGGQTVLALTERGSKGLMGRLRVVVLLG